MQEVARDMTPSCIMPSAVLLCRTPVDDRFFFDLMTSDTEQHVRWTIQQYNRIMSLSVIISGEVDATERWNCRSTAYNATRSTQSTVSCTRATLPTKLTRKGMANFVAAILGASGQVGGCVVKSLLAEPRCTSVILFNRRKLEAYTNEPRVKQHVVDMDKLATDVV